MRKNRFMYIGIGLLMFLCLGTIYSWSVFQKPLVDAFEKLNGEEVPQTIANMPYTVFLLAYAFSMPFAGKLIAKTSPKLVSIIGTAFVAVAWISSSIVGSMQTLIFTYGLLGGIGVGIIYGVPLAVVSKWYPEKKGFAVGLTLLGFGLSPFITAPISEKLIRAFGVFNTFRILGIAFLIILAFFSMFLRYPAFKKDSEEVDLTVHYSLKDMIKTSQFYGLWSCYTIGTLAGLMIIGISSVYAQEVLGFTSTKAAFLTSFFAIFNGLGRPVFGAITDKLGSKKAAIISYSSILAVSILILIFSQSRVVFVFTFSVMWANLGGWLSIAPASTSNIFGHKYYSENYGLVFTAYGIGALIQGFLSGIVKDIFGSYLYVFYPLIILVILGIFIANFTLDEIDEKAKKVLE
ncbi:MAG: L-lactate MFS transporter [Fusobacteriota bacterium]